MLEQLAHGPERLLDAGRARPQPEECGQRAVNGLALGCVGEQRRELTQGLWRRITIADPPGVPEHRRDRPERDAVAVGKAASLQCGRPVADPREQLASQTRLPTAGVPHDRDESTRPRCCAALERVLELRELLPAAYQLGIETAARPARATDEPSRRHAATGFAMPFRSRGPTGSAAMTSRTNR